MNKRRFGFGLLLLLAAPVWAAPVTVSFEPANSVVTVGQSIDINVVADIPDPVVAFGVDLSFTNTLLTLTSTVFGPAWTPVPPPPPPASDGVGFGAVLTPTFPPPPPPGGISGTDILLFTLTFQGQATGASLLELSATVGDPNEGFLLAGGGFAEVDFLPGTVNVAPIPLPASGALMIGGLVALFVHRRRIVG